MEDEKERKRKAILEELQLLEKMRKEQEWVIFDQKELKT